MNAQLQYMEKKREQQSRALVVMDGSTLIVRRHKTSRTIAVPDEHDVVLHMLQRLHKEGRIKLLKL